jgi:hypothetical protein
MTGDHGIRLLQRLLEGLLQGWYRCARVTSARSLGLHIFHGHALQLQSAAILLFPILPFKEVILRW